MYNSKYLILTQFIISLISYSRYFIVIYNFKASFLLNYQEVSFKNSLFSKKVMNSMWYIIILH